MKSLIAFKKRLEDQLEKLAAETKEVQDSLDTVNTILLDKGFKRGDIKEVTEAPPAMPKEIVLPKPEARTPNGYCSTAARLSQIRPRKRHTTKNDGGRTFGAHLF